MKKNVTELVFILDRSGSMSGLECDTIGSFNSMIEKQKREEGEVSKMYITKLHGRFCRGALLHRCSLSVCIDFQRKRW